VSAGEDLLICRFHLKLLRTKVLNTKVRKVEST
jgi:hypothetical protein